MQVFGYLKLSMALLGSSWPLLGPIWSPSGPQNGSQNNSKVVPKIVQTTIPKKEDFKPIVGPKMGPKICIFGGGPPRANPAGALLKALVFGSKMAQGGLKKPKIASWEPFWVSRGSLGRPWTSKNLKKKQWFFKVFANVGLR